ncbi:hypothetical protein [uncultured Methylobacterium sp.]|uniref:hypothetical protein n=1 Tax=uncultured Methylobacterium sp. TaxID=157278 RepID=UPI0035CAA94B
MPAAHHIAAPAVCEAASKGRTRMDQQLASKGQIEDPASFLHPSESAEAILAHRRFPAARTAYIAGIMSLYENNPFLSRLICEAGRSVVFFVILCLHAGSDDDDPETWLTIGLLRRTVATYGITSQRRIDELIGRLVETRYLAIRTPSSDRRLRILAPTERMLAHDRDWLAVHYRPLDILHPDPGYGPALDGDPAFQRAHRRISIQMSAYATSLMAQNQVAMMFLIREAGIPILMKLIQGLEGREGEAWQPVSFTDLGDRFGVSRTHVRNLLRDVAEMGLAAISGHEILLRPPLLAAHDRFVADGMVGHILTFRMAMESLGRAFGMRRQALPLA